MSEFYVIRVFNECSSIFRKCIELAVATIATLNPFDKSCPAISLALITATEPDTPKIMVLKGEVLS